MNQLIKIMAHLRSPRGCPWDRKQTFASLMSCLLEETYEIIDAVDARRTDKLAEELGDLLCIVSMIIAIGEERRVFSRRSVLNQAAAKMKHRHPHVFGTARAHTSQSAHTLWHTAKNKEKGVRARRYFLDDLSRIFPALHRADKIQRRVARVGFDWPTLRGALGKVDEELCEMKKELRRKPFRKATIAEEIGDLLFAVVNIGRKLDINGEMALRKTNEKFIRRFTFIERELKKQGKKLGSVSLREMDRLWNMSKRRRRSSRSARS